LDANLHDKKEHMAQVMAKIFKTCFHLNSRPLWRISMKKYSWLLIALLFSSIATADTPPPNTVKAKVYSGDGATAVTTTGTALDVNVSGGTISGTVNQGNAGVQSWLTQVTSSALPTNACKETGGNLDNIYAKLNSSIAVTGTFFQPTQPVSGTLTCNAGTGTFNVDASAHTVPVSGTFFQATQPVSIASTVLVDGSAHTQPVSGTITANQGTSPWVVSGSVAITGPVAVTGSFGITGTVGVSGTVTSLQGTSPWVVSGTVSTTGTTSVTGTVTANQGTNPWNIAGAVSQTGTWNIGTVSTITNPVSVTGSVGITGPVSITGNVGVTGTVTSLQGTTPWTISGAVSQTGSWSTAITGPVTVNQGTNPWITDRTWVLDNTTDSVSVSQGGPFTVGLLNTTSSSSISSFPGGGSAGLSSATSVGLSVEGTFVGTIEFLFSIDGVNYFPFKMVPFDSGQAVMSDNITAPGTWVANLAGASSIKFASTSWTSGTADIVVNSSPTSHVVEILSGDASNVLETSYQGGSWSVAQSGTWNIGTLTSITNPVTVTGTVAVTGPVGITGNVNVTQGTNPWVVSPTGTTAVTGTVTANQGTNPWVVATTGSVSVTGTVTANAGTNLNTSALNLETTQSDFSAKFPSAGALADTSANPTTTSIASYLFGYNGSTWDRLRSTTTNGLAVDVTRVQGSVAVSGNVGITGTVPVTQSTSPWVISGNVGQTGSWSVTANAGTNLNTSALALDTTVSGLQVSQGSTTGGQNGPLVQGAVTTASPSYTTAKTNPLSLTTAGALRVDGSAVTQPVSGTIAVTGTVPVTQSTSPWVISGTVSTTGTVAITGTVTANAGTNLNTSALALDTSVTGLQVSQASTSSGQNGTLIQGAVTTSAPSYTTAKTNPLSLNTSGGLRVDGSGVTQPVSGTVAITGSTSVTGTVAVTGNVNVTQGTSPWVVSGTVSTTGSTSVTGTVAVTGVTAVSGTVAISGSVTTNSATTTSGGMTSFRNTGVSNTAVAVKASAGNLYYYHVYNTNSADCYFQLYDVAQGSVTVGTTTPTLTFAVPAGGLIDGSFDSAPMTFATAITIATTTTVTGGTACTTAMLTNLGYK
jgi:hypothetical protein